MNFTASTNRMTVTPLRQTSEEETAYFNKKLYNMNRNAVIMLHVSKVLGIITALVGIYIGYKSLGSFNSGDELFGGIFITLLGTGLALLGFKAKAAGDGLARCESYPVYSVTGTLIIEYRWVGKHKVAVYLIGGVPVAKPFKWLMGAEEGEQISVEVADFHGELHLLNTPAGHSLAADIQS